jgi:WhiB family transcriptional regulator, redox-sensing transcriptional regulator
MTMGDAAVDDLFHERWARQSWMSYARCKGERHLFFPPLAERPQARLRREARARLVCEACPVQSPCRLFARVHREYGFWGGESEEDRGDAGYPVPSPIGGRARKRRLARLAASG